MRIPLLMVAAGSAFLTATPLQAQGAFNMGVLTNTVSQSHNTQSERARAGRRRGPTLGQRQACANLPRFRDEYGADNPKVGRLASLCRRAGLSVR